MAKKWLCFVCVLSIFFVAIPKFAAEERIYYPSNYNNDIPEEYKEFYDITPTIAWRGAYTELTDIPNMELTWNFTQILFMKLFSQKVITRPEFQDNGNRPEDNPSALRIPREKVKTVFEESFGPDSFEKVFGDMELIHNYNDNLFYEPSTDCYVYTLYCWGGGERTASEQIRFVKAEQTNDELVLYFRLLVYTVDKIYGDWNLTDQENRLILSDGYHAPDQIKELLNDGRLDEYLPVYKHTFKDNGQGGYYWFSSEMVEQGSPIPEELFPPMENPEKNPPSTDGNHTILGGNWGSITQPSTETQTPSDDTLTPEPSVDSAPLWGVIAGWGAVAVALAAGVGLVIKQYKK